MKNTIRINQTELHNIIRESVERILKEERSGDWNQYELKDFAHNVLNGIVWKPGIIRSATYEDYRYIMRGRSLKITFPEPDGAEYFLETEAESYPDYKFLPVPDDPSSMIVKCKFDEYWGS